MNLVGNWRKLIKRAWSVRLFALSALCQAADVVITTRGAFHNDPDTRIALQLIGVAFACAGLVARFIFQRGLHE